MLRCVAFAFLIATVTSQPTDSPTIEFLRNFGHNPLLGDVVGNIINRLENGTSYSQEQEGYGPDQESAPKKTYAFTRWTDFGVCSKVCGTGIRRRSRYCLDETGVQHHLGKCFTSMSQVSWDMVTLLKARKQMKEEDEELCNKHECQTTEWQFTKSCSQECGGGMVTYTRRCLNSVDQDLCNMRKKKMEPCNTDPCFRLGDWRPWSRCTRECGGGQSSRSRSCEPNVHPYSQLYSELQYVLQNVGRGGLLSSSSGQPDQVFYVDQYLKTCGTNTVQTRFCNAENCPSCDYNQIYYHCKPCRRFCKKIDISNIAELDIEMPKFDRSVSGCGGECEKGCGCPLFEPLLGFDGKCYSMDLMCPQNQVNPSMQSFMMLQYMMMKYQQIREQKVAEKAAAKAAAEKAAAEEAAAKAAAERALATAEPKTKKPRKGKRKPKTKKPTDSYPPTMPTHETTEYGIYTIATEEQTYAPEPTYVTSQETEHVGILPEKPDCPFDIHILDRNMCVCTDGVLNEVPCLPASTDDKCPVICKMKGTCPNPEKRLKSSLECTTNVCNSDDDCTGDFMCCQIDCGRRCVYPAM